MSNAKAERFLIVDDDSNLVEAYALFFEAYGYTIRRLRTASTHSPPTAPGVLTW